MTRLLAIILFTAILVLPTVSVTGCASQGTTPAAGKFSLPKFPKNEKKTKPVKKNAKNPSTVGGFLALPR